MACHNSYLWHKSATVLWLDNSVPHCCRKSVMNVSLSSYIVLFDDNVILLISLPILLFFSIDSPNIWQYLHCSVYHRDWTEDDHFWIFISYWCILPVRVQFVGFTRRHRVSHFDLSVSFVSIMQQLFHDPQICYDFDTLLGDV